MTKEDFKKKYHGKSVKIEPSMQVQRLGEIAERPRRIQEMCKLMGLEAHQVTVPAPYLLITIVDKAQPPYPYSHAEASEPVSEQEFLDDFKEAQEELEFGRAKKLLADFKIEYGSITKKNKSCTSTDMVDEGFIQGYTSNEARENYEKGCDLFLNEEVQEIKAAGEDIKQVIKSSDKKAYILCVILLIALIIKFIIG